MQPCKWAQWSSTFHLLINLFIQGVHSRTKTETKTVISRLQDETEQYDSKTTRSLLPRRWQVHWTGEWWRVGRQWWQMTDTWTRKTWQSPCIASCGTRRSTPLRTLWTRRKTAACWRGRHASLPSSRYGLLTRLVRRRLHITSDMSSQLLQNQRHLKVNVHR